ncbi:MAG: DUF1772 domain-containing protein [Acidimicrobiales bacterium]
MTTSLDPRAVQPVETKALETKAVPPAFSVRQLTLLIATVLTGLSAGFFYTYSVSVTRGLAAISDAAYLETFQSINATIRTPAFALIFFGPIPAIILAIVANRSARSTVARWLIALALPLYIAAFLVTFAGNVPLNNELAEVVNATPAEMAEARDDFEDLWNLLNLIRTGFVLAGFAALATAGLLPTDDNRAADHAMSTTNDQTGRR